MSRYKLLLLFALLSRRSCAGERLLGRRAVQGRNKHALESCCCPGKQLLPAPWGEWASESTWRSRKSHFTESTLREKCKSRHFALASRKSFSKAYIPSKFGQMRPRHRDLQPRTRQKVLQRLHQIEGEDGTKQALGWPHLHKWHGFWLSKTGYAITNSTWKRRVTSWWLLLEMHSPATELVSLLWSFAVQQTFLSRRFKDICKFLWNLKKVAIKPPAKPPSHEDFKYTIIMVSSNCSTEDSFKYTLYGCIFSMVFVLGLIANCAAIYIFTCTLKVRNETTTYMLNLAISDLLFVFTLPFRIYYFIARNWPFGDILCKISVTLFYTNMYGSILFLTCISVDRFLAIVHPFRSKTLRTKRNAKIVCAAVWITVLAGSTPASFFQSTNRRNNTEQRTCFENFSEDTWKTYLSRIVIFIEIVGFFIPLILNVTCSTMVLRTLNKPLTLSRNKLSKKKVLKMIFVHLVIFCFCFVPYNVTLILYSLMRTQTWINCSVVTAVRTMYPVTLCIAVSNCCFDPIVYYFTSDTIQNSIKKNRTTRLRNITFSETPVSENFIHHSLQSIKMKIFDSDSTI